MNREELLNQIRSMQIKEQQPENDTDTLSVIVALVAIICLIILYVK